MRRRIDARALRTTALIATLLASAGVALAYFTSAGAGNAQATVATIVGPSNLSVQQTGNTVVLSWVAATLSAGGAVSGYRVTRSDGHSVCGATTPVTSLSCSDTVTVAGTYTYTVMAVYHSWDASATTAVVTILTTPNLTSSPSAASAATTTSFGFSGGGSAYACQLDGGPPSSCTSPKAYSSLSAGSHTFKVHATNGSATGPDAVYTWTVDSTAPTITTQPSSPSATSSPSFSFTHAQSAYAFKCQLDGAGFAACPSPDALSGVGDGSHTFQVEGVSGDGASTVAASYTWLVDTTAPSGGSISYTNGYLTTTSVSVSFAAGSDAGSGLNSVAAKLERATATLSNGSCGTFSAFSQVGSASPTSPYLDTTVASGSCYEYEYLVVDNVGSQTTYTTVSVAKIDTQAPTQGLSLAAASGAFLSGGTLYYAAGTAGSFKLADAVTDGASGPAAASFPAIATTGWTHPAETVSAPAGGPYSSGTFSWTAGPSTPSAYTVSAADAAGNSATTSISFAADTTAPSGGALSVNGITASVGGSSSTVLAPNTTFTIGGRTDYTEAQSAIQSGLASSVLTVQSETLNGTTCGSPGSGGPFTTAATITATTQPAGIQGGYCYLYTLIGTDHVGNLASIKTTVQDPIAISSLTLANGASTAGRAEQNDTITVVFNGPIAVTSLCSAWSGNTSNQSLSDGTVAFSALLSNDKVNFSSPSCSGGFGLGTIDLGSAAYFTITAPSFGPSAISYTAATFTLKITLGTQSALSLTGTVTTSVATLTPGAGIVGLDNNHPGNFATATVRQF